MNKYILCIAILLSIKINGSAQSYGLAFNSHEVVLEKRTAIDLSPEDSFCFQKDFALAFEFQFIPNHQIYFGYLFRLISNDNRNIDLIYNQPSSSFKLITGENFSGISFTIDSLRLYKKWNLFSLKCDQDNHLIQCFVNGRLIGTGRLPASGNCFKILFGANDFQKFKTRDLPPMQIRNIRIREENKDRYFWPLDETAGDLCYDKIRHKPAKVRNPEWLKPKYQKWEMIGSFTINGYAGVAYDATQDKLYIGGSDSLAVYTLKNERHMDWSPSQHQDLLLGHQFIYDTISKRLLDIYIDLKKPLVYDFSHQRWDFALPTGRVNITGFWHANKFISSLDTSLYTFGGYGYLRYKNEVQQYHFATKKWDSLKPTGDYFSPRYLSALGAGPEGKFVYILGGYGSQTGDQMLDPRYYYDLLRYDVQRNSFKKLFSFKPQTTPFTFANSLIIDSNAIYGLVFSNDSFNSNLQLIRGSLKDSTFSLLGSPIPYNFHDIQSFADLYYSPVSNKLIAVTLFYTPEEAKEKNTEVKIYSVNFPPEPVDVPPAGQAEAKNRNWFFFLLGGLLLAGAGLILFRKKRRRPESRILQSIATEELPGISNTAFRQSHPDPAPRSAIYLFGQFQVFDRDGNDITRAFTPLLKELFLIISVYTFRNGRGISSEGLNEILWHDKSEKDAKNNRSVNIAKLKTILERTGNCVINKESGYWQLISPDDGVFVDYKNYVSLSGSVSGTDREYICAVLNIIKRGALLTQTEYNWLDNIKSEVSNSVIDICLGFIRTQDLAKDPEFIIEITNYIFYFDQLNEDALICKCKCLILLKRHTLANNCYLRFVKDYKDIYGEEFSRSFHEVIT